ncbi:MAG TPA: signal peptidase I [Thermoleophilaceae bacterium]
MRRNTFVELLVTIAVALAVAFTIQALAIKPYRIPSPSMEPTLDIGQRVLVSRIGHRLGQDPKVGDVVVFDPPAGAGAGVCADRSSGDGTRRPCSKPGNGKASEVYIKRVVAVGGDTISIRNGRVIRNGHAAREPFIRPCGGGSGCDFPEPIRVPQGTVYVMGDNRGASDDSRYWGPVSIGRIIGKAFATYWPPSRLGGL